MRTLFSLLLLLTAQPPLEERVKIIVLGSTSCQPCVKWEREVLTSLRSTGWTKKQIEYITCEGLPLYMTVIRYEDQVPTHITHGYLTPTEVRTFFYTGKKELTVE